MLPKLHGSEKIIGETLIKLHEKCSASSFKIEELEKYPSSAAKLEEMIDIFKEFFNSIYDNMKDDAYLCMASPHYVDLKPMADEVGFEIVEQYGIKMHRSLTRIISVIAKID